MQFEDLLEFISEENKRLRNKYGNYSDEEKRTTAIHEAGHALLATILPNADPIHKVTIIPRGLAMGLTQQLPIDEKHNYSKPYLEDTITVLLGGRVAEEITDNIIGLNLPI